MRDALTFSTAGTLVMIGLLHVYWACGGRLSLDAAVPTVGGVATFSPSPIATWLVAFALMGAALVVAAAGNVLTPPLPDWIWRAAAVLLALVFLARAIGDFRLVGFFKMRGDGSFATLDSWVYSPLCLLLAAAIATILVVRGDKS